MSAGSIDIAAIAAGLTEAERQYLLGLPGDGYAKQPSVVLSQMLLFGHGVPLISIVGDWAKATRVGTRVVAQLVAAERKS